MALEPNCSRDSRKCPSYCQAVVIALNTLSVTAIKYYEAAALYHNPPHRYCIITPNEDWIPPVPSQDGYTNSHIVLEHYADGSFGPHEYSTQPQIWDPTRPHLPWIPRDPAAVHSRGGLEVLWRPLETDDYTRIRPNSEFYRISDPFERELQKALQPLKRLTDRLASDTSEETRRIINACELARHSVIHVRFTDGHTLPALVDLVKGAKRHILECLGHVNRERYMRRVRDKSEVTDFATAVYDVVGLFTYSLDVTREHVKMCVPVWRIVQVDRLPPDFKIQRRLPLTRTPYPHGARRLIAHVYGGDPYIAKLVVASPSQGLYVNIPGTALFRFAGSVNTAGEITSVIRVDDQDGGLHEHGNAPQEQGSALQGRGSAPPRGRGSASRHARGQGGPDRTYPGVYLNLSVARSLFTYARFSDPRGTRHCRGGKPCSTTWSSSRPRVRAHWGVRHRRGWHRHKS